MYSFYGGGEGLARELTVATKSRTLAARMPNFKSDANRRSKSVVFGLVVGVTRSSRSEAMFNLPSSQCIPEMVDAP